MTKKSSKQLLAEAVVELAKTKPVDKITIREIVETAGLSTQTFYNHFADRDALLLFVHTSLLDDLIVRLYRDENYGLRGLIHDYLYYYFDNDNKDFMLNVFINTFGENNHLVAFSTYATEQTKKYLCHLMNVDELPEDLAFYVQTYVFSQAYIYVHWAMEDSKIPLDRREEYLIRATPMPLIPYFFPNENL